MKKSNNKIFITAICITLAIMAIALRYALPLENKVMQPDITGPIIRMNNVHLTGMVNKTKAWSLSANKVELSQNKSTTTITNITNGKIFNAGQPAFNVTAGKAKYDIWTKSLQLSKNIKIVGEDGQVISADSIYLTSRGILTNSGKIKINNKFGEISANRLLINIPKRELTAWDINFNLNMETH